MLDKTQDVLTGDDLRTLRHCFDARRSLDRGREICGSSDHIHVVLRGLAGRQESFRDGRRQIIMLHFSGEFCDIDRLFNADLDHSARALADCVVATMPIGRVRDAIETSTAIRDLFWASTVFDNVVLNRRVSTLGCGTAHERLARFFCDLVVRLRCREELTEDVISLGLSQSDMAEHLGLSLVHTNRTLQDLKAEGLIGSRGSSYTILDLPRLQALGGALSEAQRAIDARAAAIAATIRAAAAL